MVDYLQQISSISVIFLRSEINTDGTGQTSRERDGQGENIRPPLHSIRPPVRLGVRPQLLSTEQTVASSLVLSTGQRMAAYLGYTLRMKTLFRGWPIIVHDTHKRRRRTECDARNLLFTVLTSVVLTTSVEEEAGKLSFRSVIVLFLSRGIAR